jgi:hypothetical protein
VGSAITRRRSRISRNNSVCSFKAKSQSIKMLVMRIDYDRKIPLSMSLGRKARPAAAGCQNFPMRLFALRANSGSLDPTRSFALRTISLRSA